MGDVWTRRSGGVRVGAWLLGGALGLGVCVAQAPVEGAAAGTASTPAVAAQVPAAEAQAPAVQGGTIKGTVVAGSTDAKADAKAKGAGIPLPGVAVTATNTLTGKRYTTATDIDGNYAMVIPKNGRYVVKAELAGFVVPTQEVVLGGAGGGSVPGEKTLGFGMELASRAAADEAKAATGSAAGGTSLAGLARGLQGLTLNAGGLDAADASAGTGNAGTALPSLAGLNDSVTGGTAGSGADAIAVSGQQGQTSALGGISEDEIRQRVEDAVAQGRASGMIPQGGDPTNAIVSAIGGMMGGGGGGFGGGGGARGGRGGGGAGGAFRNFNPAQPHGNIFYQGGNAALNSSRWLVSAPGLPHFTPNPSAYSNRFGASIAGSPYIPGLTKPNTKQFVFINLTGQKNLNAFEQSGRVPTALERTGNFSQSFQSANGAVLPVTLYDPRTGAMIAGNNLANASVPVSARALALLNYYPAPNLVTTDPTAFNYQTVANAGSNNVAINSRYTRQLGQATSTPFGAFGGAGGGGGGRTGRAGANTPPALHQSINVGYNYSHSASDQRNIFLPLGGSTASDGNSLNVGYTIGYGRLSNNASVNWNRSTAETRNYFTDTVNNPSATAGLSVPNMTGGFADARFYNGLASQSIANFSGLSNTTPSESLNQTIAFSDFVSWRHKKHNMRYGVDVRRVHADSIGGNNPLGSYTFTGYATASPADQVAGSGGQTSGSGFADFLLGLPESTQIQAGLYKIYLRENVYDWYAQDDYRVLANVTLNYGLRYEYFGPYSEKNNRLVNLDHNAALTAFDTVQPGGTGTYQGQFNSSLLNPDKALYAPRFGFAWRPKPSEKLLQKLARDLVVRGGYGVNYNTGQFAQIAQSLSHQPPFAVTQTNAVATPTKVNPTPAATGCMTTQAAYTYTDASGVQRTRAASTANVTLANGFGCATGLAIQNNFAVDRNYRLGMVQVYNLNIQRTLPLQIVLNIGYNGSKGSHLDVLGSPNGTPSGTTTPGIAPFDYEEAAASSHSNQLVVSAQKRQQKGIALGVTYTYQHAIDNASGVGGVAGTPVQNLFNLAAEEGNSSFDQRHNLTGNWVLELPFGPNRKYFNKGGFTSKLLDGYSLSGTFTFASGTYFTPQYSGNQAEASAGNTFTQRPNRDFTQPLRGPGTLNAFFNKAAFTAPAAGQYGTASPGSIEGPGTVSVNTSLSRTVTLGGTRSFEARATASNVFNTVQYSGINTQLNSATFGEVTSAAAMRVLQVQARYRF